MYYNYLSLIVIIIDFGVLELSVVAGRNLVGMDRNGEISPLPSHAFLVSEWFSIVPFK